MDNARITLKNQFKSIICASMVLNKRLDRINISTNDIDFSRC